VPRLTCPEVVEAGAGIFIEPVGHEEAATRWRTAAQRCYERLVGEGYRLDRYNTAAHVRDAGELLGQLGYRSWNIVAVSYGTRIAANLLRQEEKSVRSIVLDSVLPADARAYLETAENAARAFERLSEHCAAEPKCNAQAPKLLEKTFAALERAGKTPLTVALPRPGEKPLRVSLDSAKLAEVLMYAFYDAEKTRELPAAITAVSRGKLEPLAPFAQQALDTYTSEAISHGLFFSVICRDEFPFNAPQDIASAADRSGPLKQFALADLGLVACPAWPVGAADGSARTPVASDVPVLILSGELDPATPPEYATRVAASLTSARIYRFPWIGHGVIGAHECADKLVAGFLADPRAAKLDECGARLGVQR
jgi:pimeloyl-ACP methyl ester carboxylesterase